MYILLVSCAVVQFPGLDDHYGSMEWVDILDCLKMVRQHVHTMDERLIFDKDYLEAHGKKGKVPVLRVWNPDGHEIQIVKMGDESHEWYKHGVWRYGPDNVFIPAWYANAVIQEAKALKPDVS